MPYKVSNLNGTFQQQYEADPRIVAALAARKQADEVPIYSPGQGVARALSKMLDAYTQKQIQGEYQQKQTDQNGALADALAPTTDNPGLQAPPVQLPTTSTPVDNGALGQSNIQTGGGQIDASVPDYQTENPNRSKISALLNSGLISGSTPSVASALMKGVGMGEASAPIKGSPGDTFFDPVTHQPIPGMSAPFKPDKPEPLKAPTTREVNSGDYVITQEFDPTAGKWNDVAKAPRYRPTTINNAPKVPLGYRETPDGNLSYIPGGPADPTKGAGKKAPSEDQAKNMQLYQRASQQLGILMGDGGKNPGTFDSLASKSDQLGAAASHIGIPFTNIGVPRSLVTGEQFQRAESALKDIAASYLYSVSGATANPGEVANLTDTVTPKFGDKPGAVADKKARIKQMVDSIKTRAAGAVPQGSGEAAGGKPPTVSNW